MTLFVNHITIPSSHSASSSAVDADEKGTQIPTRTLRERRGVTSFIQIESYPLAVDNDDKGLKQPKGHLQPTVMNIPRRRRAPVKDAPIVYIPSPLSSPSTPSSSAVAYCEGTQNHPRTPCERSADGETLRTNFNRAKIEEWRRGVMSPEGQRPISEEPALWEASSPVTLSPTSSLFSPCTPPSDSAHLSAELNGRQNLSQTLRDRRGVTLFIHFESCKTTGWPKQRGPQPKGHLEPTVANLPRRHKRDVYGPMIHSRLPCNFY